jgi:hypothetical protein
MDLSLDELKSYETRLKIMVEGIFYFDISLNRTDEAFKQLRFP